MTHPNVLSVGYKPCTNPLCGKPVHYRVKTCKACMAVQHRDAADQEPRKLVDASGLEIQVERTYEGAAKVENTGATAADAAAPVPPPSAAPIHSIVAAVASLPRPSITFAAPAPPLTLVRPSLDEYGPRVVIDPLEVFGPILVVAPPQPGPDEQQAGDYFVLESFNGQVGNVLCVLRKGMVLTDTNLIAELRDIGAPIVPVSQVDGMACCPACKNVFQLAKAGTPGAARRAG